MQQHVYVVLIFPPFPFLAQLFLLTPSSHSSLVLHFITPHSFFSFFLLLFLVSSLWLLPSRLSPCPHNTSMALSCWKSDAPFLPFFCCKSINQSIVGVVHRFVFAPPLPPSLSAKQTSSALSLGVLSFFLSFLVLSCFRLPGPF